MTWNWLWGKQPELHPEQTALAPKSEPWHKPRIIISMDRSWHNFLGITWLLFYHMIRRAGGVPRSVDYGAGPEPENIDDTARGIVQQGDGLLLSGGSDVDPNLYGGKSANRVNPRRDRFEMALIREARARRIPILGICRGCQLLNVALGGTLHTIKADERMRALHNRFRLHSVHLNPQSRIAKTTRRTELSILSIHGQAVLQPAPELHVSGQAEDGVIEAIELSPETPNWIVGVQWHPEYLLYRRPEHRIVRNFVRAAQRIKVPG